MSLRFLYCTILSTFACSPGESISSPVTLELVADGFVHPLLLTESPDGTGRLFVIDQIGKIWILGPKGEKLPEPFLDLSAQLVELDPSYDERGLLGMAFHPAYASNGRFYVFYSAPLSEQAPAGFDHTNILAEYRVMPDDPNRVDVGSERRLLVIDHPYGNHNAGMLAFGPDDLLYLSLGDGGNRDDQDMGTVKGHVEDWYAVNGGGNGQDIEHNLLGSILRIDVNRTSEDDQGVVTPYAIPEDNPFVGVPGVLGETWAYGFRNPYRFTLDPGGSHQLIVGDVGQDMYEEISRVTRGGNYGWNVYEGAHCFDAASPKQPLASCPSVVGPGSPAAGDPLILPVIELENTDSFAADGVGIAVVGGVVDRGESLPSAYRGRYLFGMWSAGLTDTQAGEGHRPGRLLVATMAANGPWSWEPLRLAGSNEGDLDAYLLGFGQDIAGDVFVLTTQDVGPTGHSGKVQRLVAAPPGS